MNGIVKWFDPKRGYGFIICAAADRPRPDSPREVYVHYTGIERKGFRTLSAGDAVEFEVHPDSRGPRAEKVVLVNRPDRPTASAAVA